MSCANTAVRAVPESWHLPLRGVGWGLACLLVFQAGACAMRPATPVFTAQTGLASRPDVQYYVPRLLELHGYRTLRAEESAGELYFETEWKQGTSPEQEGGSVEPERSRIIVRARDAGRSLYRVDMIIEREVEAEGSWRRTGPTEAFQRYAARIASDFEMHFRSGVRRLD